MGRLIEESRVVDILQQTWLSGTIAHRFIDDIKRRIRIEVPTVEAIPKADYEDRLRAEKIAMLEELRLEADKLKGPQYNVAYWVGFFAYDDFIKKKINALKEQEDGKNDI